MIDSRGGRHHPDIFRTKLGGILLGKVKDEEEVRQHNRDGGCSYLSLIAPTVLVRRCLKTSNNTVERLMVPWCIRVDRIGELVRTKG